MIFTEYVSGKQAGAFSTEESGGADSSVFLLRTRWGDFKPFGKWRKEFGEAESPRGPSEWE